MQTIRETQKNSIIKLENLLEEIKNELKSTKINTNNFYIENFQIQYKQDYFNCFDIQDFQKVLKNKNVLYHISANYDDYFNRTPIQNITVLFCIYYSDNLDFITKTPH
jgi:hypothetical protein